MKFIELFAGIGGFRYGLERVCIKNQEQPEGVEIGNQKRLSNEQFNICNKRQFTCVYSNEWDKYASTIYKKHYGEIDTRDITTVKAEEIPDHELLVGGFPCQAFSIAGKRGGFEDTRGTLFFEIARILQQKQPRLLLLENVKGLLSHDKGKTFGTILNTLDELGYDLQWQVLNSKNFGVPQNRERVFIVGHLRGTSRPEVFPVGEVSARVSEQEEQELSLQTNGKNRENESNSNGKVLQTRNHRSLHKGNSLKELTTGQSQGYRVYDPSGVSTTLASEGGGVGAKTGLYAVQPLMIRRLTPTECERLQGFPEIEKSVIIELCLDQAKSSVNAGNKNHRLQKSVGSVEKTDLQENASVGKSLNTKLQPTSKPVQPDVVINCVENGVEILSQGKSLLNVHTATNNDTSALQMPIESFVRLIAGITQIVEQITQCGKEESQVKEPSLIIQENGTNYVKLYGIEKTQLAKDAKLDSTTLKELTKYIILYPSGLKASDTNLQTLFSYATRAISGYIQELIPQKSSLVFRLNTKLGYTFGVSDTQRYKCLGNAVTTNVITAIGERLCQ